MQGYEIGELGVVLVLPQATFVEPMETKRLALQQLLGIFYWGIISAGSGAVYSVADVPIPPLIEFCCGSLPLQRLILLEKVDNELIELLVVESIVFVHPVGGIGERKMQLGECVSLENQQRK